MNPDRWSFRSLSLHAKVVLVVVVIVTGLVVLTVLNALASRGDQMRALERQLQSQVDSAEGIAAGYQARADKGEFSQAEAEKRALAQIGNMRWNAGKGYVFAFDTRLVMRLHPLEPRLVGKDLNGVADPDGGNHYAKMRDADVAAGHALVRYMQKMPAGNYQPKLTYAVLFQPWNLNFAAGAYFNDIDAQFRHELMASLAQASVLGLLVILIVWLSMRSIRQSIGGEPALSAALVNRMADGDLVVDGADHLQLEPGSMMHAMQRLHVKLLEVLGQAQQSARVVNSAAEQIASGNEELSSRTEEQASSLQETAASMEEIASTVKQNAENASEASRLAGGAREQAEQGGRIAAEAVAAMGEITQSSRKIEDIVGLIDEIAFQTNLLALNAAVEAARAGEQGRGFAVVASEVRNLAQRSSAAAKEIKELIGESVARVEAGSTLVEKSGAALEGIVKSVRKVTDIVAEIATAGQEQSKGIEQVNLAVSQMDEVTQRNAALVEKAAGAAQTMHQQARALAEQVMYFRLSADQASAEPAGVDRRPPPVRTGAAVPGPQTPRRRTPTLRAADAAGHDAAEEAWTEF